MQDDGVCPRGRGALRPRLEAVQPGARGVPFARADRGVDPVERTPQDDRRRGDLATAPERLLGPTESQLQHCQRPLRVLRDDPDPACGGELTTLRRQCTAFVLGSFERRDEAEQDEVLRDQVVLADLPREPDPLPRVGLGRGPAARPDLRGGESGRICVTMLSAPLVRARAAASRWARYAASSSPR